jgi:type VI secretion system protein ImpL
VPVGTPLPRVAAKPPSGGAPPPPVVKPGDIAALNDRGAGICTDLRPMLAKFPFNPDAQPEASLAEVKELLAPKTGKLWVLYDERLAGFLEKQGDRYVPRADSPIALSQAFVEFFNRAARVSAALFPNESPEPRVELTVRGVLAGNLRDITITQGNQTAHFGPGSTSPAQLVWPSQTGREARLVARVRRSARGDYDVTMARETGEWALFRVFARAVKVEGGRAEWAGRNGADPVAVSYGSPSGNAVLERGALGAMGCAAQVTR